jgi:hypothetical protein
VNDLSGLFLGVIALATLIMASIQIGALVIALRLGREVKQLASTVQNDLRPLIARATMIADDAARTAALATTQAQKLDRLLTDVSRRVDETSAIIQTAIITPAREGIALVAALKAGLSALRTIRPFRSRTGIVEDEDALFIG